MSQTIRKSSKPFFLPITVDPRLVLLIRSNYFRVSGSADQVLIFFIFSKKYNFFGISLLNLMTLNIKDEQFVLILYLKQFYITRKLEF